jgi:hypothetical protein
MKQFIYANRWYLVGAGFVGASAFCFIRHGVDLEQQFQKKLRDVWGEATDLNRTAANPPKPPPTYGA